MALRILSLAGLAAYKLNDPAARLYAVAGANVVVMVSHSADWMSCEGGYQGLRELCMSFGVVYLTRHSSRAGSDIILFVKACKSLKQSRSVWRR